MSFSPVILPVPIPPLSITGREKVKWIRDASREALRACAYLMGIHLKKLKKNSAGAPLPFAGTYWSVSHKPKFVAAVLAKCPVGIDIEELVPRSDAVIRKVISSSESSLNRDNNNLYFFFRVWTAKEAVLKTEGIGLAGLSKCRLIQVPDDSSMVLDFNGKTHNVSQIYLKKHIVSVVAKRKSVEWVFPASLLKTVKYHPQKKG